MVDLPADREQITPQPCVYAPHVQNISEGNADGVRHWLEKGEPLSANSTPH
jgi:hypothetical protein